MLEAVKIKINYKGIWNPVLNNPDLKSGIGLAGDTYLISENGTTELDGTLRWKKHDYLFFNGIRWIGNINFVGNEMYVNVQDQVLAAFIKWCIKKGRSPIYLRDFTNEENASDIKFNNQALQNDWLMWKSMAITFLASKSEK